jgi:hypothetical protein
MGETGANVKGIIIWLIFFVYLFESEPFHIGNGIRKELGGRF